MTMDDAELERLAVKELLREAEAHTKGTVVSERKLNPTIKANKTFLDRTLKNVISHNKREDYRIQRNCRDKLKALEKRRYKRLKREYENETNNKETNRRSSSSKRSESAFEIFSSSENELESKENVVVSQRHSSNRKISKRRRLRSGSSAKLLEDFDEVEYAQNEYYSQYFDQLAAYALASKSYYQVGKWLCYQALLAGTLENSEQHNIEDLFNMNILDNHQDQVNNEPICLSSDNDDDDDDDAISNSELSLDDDNSLISLNSCTTLPEHAVECQLIEELIDEELSGLKSNPPEADTIELSDSDSNDDYSDNDDYDDDDNNSILESKKNVSIDLTSD